MDGTAKTPQDKAPDQRATNASFTTKAKPTPAPATPSQQRLTASLAPTATLGKAPETPQSTASAKRKHAVAFETLPATIMRPTADVAHTLPEGSLEPVNEETTMAGSTPKQSNSAKRRSTCSYCNASFRDNGGKKRHENVCKHRPASVAKDVETEAKRLKCLATDRAQYAKSIEERRFVCGKCDMACGNARVLSEHKCNPEQTEEDTQAAKKAKQEHEYARDSQKMQLNLQQRRYTCDCCGKASKTAQAKTRHMNSCTADHSSNGEAEEA